MIGLKGLQDDINIAHSVNASKLHSDVSAFELLLRKLSNPIAYYIIVLLSLCLSPD